MKEELQTAIERERMEKECEEEADILRRIDEATDAGDMELILKLLDEL